MIDSVVSHDSAGYNSLPPPACVVNQIQFHQHGRVLTWLWYHVHGEISRLTLNIFVNLRP